MVLDGFGGVLLAGMLTVIFLGHRLDYGIPCLDEPRQVSLEHESVETPARKTARRFIDEAVDHHRAVAFFNEVMEMLE